MFEPFIPYPNYEHVLNGLPCFVHPGNGNTYWIAIEKKGGVQQNLSVYRMRPGSMERELVRRFVGGADSAAQIAAGGCLIDQNGALWVGASAVPPGRPNITKTGFVGGFWPPVPNVDAPYTQSGGMSGSVLFDAPLSSPQWDGRQMPADTGIAVDIPTVFGAPSVGVYHIRLVAIADAPNIKARAGRVGGAPHFVTVCTPAAHAEAHGNGPAPGPHMWISVVGGPAKIWLQIDGLG